MTPEERQRRYSAFLQRLQEANISVSLAGHITENDLKSFLGISAWVTQGWRDRGDGPPARKLGRKWIYHVEDVFARFG